MVQAQCRSLHGNGSLLSSLSFPWTGISRARSFIPERVRGRKNPLPVPTPCPHPTTISKESIPKAREREAQAENSPVPGPDREHGDRGADQAEHAWGAVHPRVLRHAGLLGRATEDL